MIIHALAKPNQIEAERKTIWRKVQEGGFKTFPVHWFYVSQMSLRAPCEMSV